MSRNEQSRIEVVQLAQRIVPLVVISIIGILVGLLLPAVNGA